MNELIAPQGGELTDLMVDEGRQATLKALALHLPSITLSESRICDLELLLNGAFSPLKGFMTQTDYESLCT